MRYEYLGVHFTIDSGKIWVAEKHIADFSYDKYFFVVPVENRYLYALQPPTIAFSLEWYIHTFIIDTLIEGRCYTDQSFLPVLHRMQNDPLCEQSLEYISSGKKSCLI